MNILFILFTSFTVSIDSFLCGFTLSFGEKQKYKIVLGINSMVLILCLLFHFAGSLLYSIIKYDLSFIGGIIIILVAIANLRSAEKEDYRNRSSLKKSLSVGVAVGIDGATADFSLTLMGFTSLWIPIIITAFHVIMVLFGIMLSKTIPISKMRMKAIAPLILLLFGIYKTASSLFF